MSCALIVYGNNYARNLYFGIDNGKMVCYNTGKFDERDLDMTNFCVSFANKFYYYSYFFTL